MVNNTAEVDEVDKANEVIATEEAVKAIVTDAFNEAEILRPMRPISRQADGAKKVDEPTSERGC